jgi:hypothetical protein
MEAGSIPGIDSEHAATRPSVLIKPRPLHAIPVEQSVTRKNGLRVDHLRPVAGHGEEKWRERAATPFVRKRGDRC